MSCSALPVRSAGEAAGQVEAALHSASTRDQHTGVHAAVLLMAADELVAVADGNPLLLATSRNWRTVTRLVNLVR